MSLTVTHEPDDDYEPDPDDAADDELSAERAMRPR